MKKSIILFKYTSRSRPDLFFRGLDSIVNNLSDKENYHILCSFDLDDTTMCNVEVTKRLNTYDNLTYYFGTSDSKIQAINRDLFNFKGDWDILVNFSDDQVFLVPGFDEEIRNDIVAAGGFDWFLHYPDSHAKAALPTMSIMGREYYHRNNFIYHPRFQNVYCDNYAMDEAKKLGRYKFVNKSIFDHLHPAWGLAPMDDQYRKTEDKEGYARDKEVYQELKKLL